MSTHSASVRPEAVETLLSSLSPAASALQWPFLVVELARIVPLPFASSCPKDPTFSVPFLNFWARRPGSEPWRGMGR